MHIVATPQDQSDENVRRVDWEENKREREELTK